jgi:hypothetical protein
MCKPFALAYTESVVWMGRGTLSDNESRKKIAPACFSRCCRQDIRFSHMGGRNRPENIA